MISFEMMQPREYFSSHDWAVPKQGNMSPTVYYSDVARWYHYTPAHEYRRPRNGVGDISYAPHRVGQGEGYGYAPAAVSGTV